MDDADGCAWIDDDTPSRHHRNGRGGCLHGLLRAIAYTFAGFFCLIALGIAFFQICAFSPHAGGVILGITIVLCVFAVPVFFVWALLPPARYSPRKPFSPKVILWAIGATFAAFFIIFLATAIPSNPHPMQAAFILLAAFAILAGGMYGAFLLARWAFRRIRARIIGTALGKLLHMNDRTRQ